MAVNLVRAVTLNVGQGMCNAIEIYDNDAPVMLVINDCGSSTFPMNWNGLKGYFDWAYTVFPKLSAVFVSHKHDDHTSKLGTYLSGFDLSECKAWFTRASGVSTQSLYSLSGVDSTNPSGSSNMHIYNITNMNKYFSAFSSAPPVSTWDYHNVVDFYIVGASMSATSNFNDNCLSLAVNFQNRWLYFPGDSTGNTYATLENEMTGWGKTAPLFTPFMVSAPHHAALVTIVRGNFSAQKFRTLFPADYVEASAYDRYGHPQLGVLLDIIGSASMGVNHHYHVCSSGPGEAWVYTDIIDDHCILTNYVEADTIPERAACYCFEIDGAGQTKVGFYDAYAAWPPPVVTQTGTKPAAPPWLYNLGLLLPQPRSAPRPVHAARRGVGKRGACARGI